MTFVECFNDTLANSQYLFPDAFNATTKKFGGLDIVVNNAGIGDEINWEKMIAINLVSFHISHFATFIVE